MTSTLPSSAFPTHPSGKGTEPGLSAHTGAPSVKASLPNVGAPGMKASLLHTNALGMKMKSLTLSFHHLAAEAYFKATNI